jgi:hypothetical protein
LGFRPLPPKNAIAFRVREIYYDEAEGEEGDAYREAKAAVAEATGWAA